MGVREVERLAIPAPFQAIGQIETGIGDMPRSVRIEPVKDSDALLTFLVHQPGPQPTLAVKLPVVEPKCLIGMWGACETFDTAIRSKVCQLAVAAQNDLTRRALCQQAGSGGDVYDVLMSGCRVVTVDLPAYDVDPQQPVAPRAPDGTFADDRVSSDCNLEVGRGHDRGSRARTAIRSHAIAAAVGVPA